MYSIHTSHRETSHVCTHACTCSLVMPTHVRRWWSTRCLRERESMARLHVRKHIGINRWGPIQASEMQDIWVPNTHTHNTHRVGPYRPTKRITVSSSSLVHAPLGMTRCAFLLCASRAAFMAIISAASADAEAMALLALPAHGPPPQSPLSER